MNYVRKNDDKEILEHNTMSDVIELIDSEGNKHQITRGAALLSATLKDMCEDLGTNTSEVPIDLMGPVLNDIVPFLERETKTTRRPNKIHGKGRMEVLETPIGEEDRVLLSRVYNTENHKAFMLLFLGANYLNIRPLIDLCAQYLADETAGLTTEEIRKKFDIKNDFAPEEEARLRSENEWTVSEGNQ